MFMRAFTAVTVALASLVLAQAAQAAQPNVVNFEDRSFTGPDTYLTEANNFSEQGLSFTGLQFYFIPKNNPDVTFPTSYGSTFMETAIEPVGMTLAGGGAFNLLSLDLGLGDFNQGSTDTVTISGIKANCATDCTVSEDLTVTNVFQTFTLDGFTGLSSISVGAQEFSNPNAPFPPQADSGYLAFDDITFTADTGAAAVPEPASWALMILGFAAAGGLLRGRRRALALTAAA
jgi:PEP-CTERM motif